MNTVIDFIIKASATELEDICSIIRVRKRLAKTSFPSQWKLTLLSIHCEELAGQQYVLTEWLCEEGSVLGIRVRVADECTYRSVLITYGNKVLKYVLTSTFTASVTGNLTAQDICYIALGTRAATRKVRDLTFKCLGLLDPNFLRYV
jgi:hypothetical protein